jgi:hypothetical protein
MSYVAKLYTAGTPQAEVIGIAVIAFAENAEADVIKPVLEKHGLGEIDPDAWYPHQLWLDVLHEVEDTFGGGATMALVAFGRQVVATAVMPPEIKTIPDVLHALHAIHHANLRNIPQEEGYQIKQVSDNHYIVYHNTPDPEDAIYGFLWGLVARFKAPDEMFAVRKINNDRPDQARSAYEVKWGKTREDVA